MAMNAQSAGLCSTMSMLDVPNKKGTIFNKTISTAFFEQNQESETKKS